MKKISSYETERDTIKDGDVIFVSKKNIVARIIRFFTLSKFSHVGIAFWADVAGRKRLFIVEAQGGAQRRIVNMSFYENNNITVIAAPRVWSDYVEEALSNLGQVKYGWLEAVYVGAREFLLKTTKYIKLPAHDLPGEICSEYVARMLLLDDVHVSPQMLYEKLLKMEHKK